MSIWSCWIRFIKLSVATLECCKFICMHLIEFCWLLFIPLLVLFADAILIVSILFVFGNHSLHAGTLSV